MEKLWGVLYTRASWNDSNPPWIKNSKKFGLFFENASVANNKMLYHSADVAVKENQESLIILPIESNIEAQTQIKPSEWDKLLAKTRVHRKELSKEDEASIDVEVNLLQQKFNKIELETLKKLQSHKQEERKNTWG